MPAVEHIIHKPEENTAYLNIGKLNIPTVTAEHGVQSITSAVNEHF